MGMNRVVVALSALALFASCSKPRPAKLDVAAPPPAPVAAAPTEPEPPASTAPSDLPAFGAGGGDPAKAADLLMEIEVQIDMVGEVAPGDDLWNQAVQAVKLDPNSAKARVMLAQIVNDDAFTEAQLGALVAADECDDCADALLNIDVEAWPVAAPIVAKVTASPQRRVIDALSAFTSSGDKASIAAYFKGKKLTITTECLSCELSGEGGGGGTKKSTGAKALSLLVSLQKDENLYTMGGWYCSMDCCAGSSSFNGTPNGNTYVQSVCFAAGTTTVTELSLID
jgi:hypothetical protein